MTTQTTPRDRILSPSEVADLFGVSAKTVTRWAKAGRIPSTRTLGGHRRYLQSDVDAALEAAKAGDES